jgi:hypothetical protein
MSDPFREALAAVVSEAKCATEAGYRLADFMPLEAARAACRNLYDEAVRRARNAEEGAAGMTEVVAAARAEADRLRAALRESEKALTFAAARMRDLGYERDRQLAPMCEDAAFHARALLAAPAPDGPPA